MRTKKRSPHLQAETETAPMGAAHSRARPGAGPAARFGGNHNHNLVKPSGRDKVTADSFGYFILCIKGGDRIKVVNASNPVLKQVGAVVRRHFAVSRAGWDRHLAYSFRSVCLCTQKKKWVE